MYHIQHTKINYSDQMRSSIPFFDYFAEQIFSFVGNQSQYELFAFKFLITFKPFDIPQIDSSFQLIQFTFGNSSYEWSVHWIEILLQWSIKSFVHLKRRSIFLVRTRFDTVRLERGKARLDSVQEGRGKMRLDAVE